MKNKFKYILLIVLFILFIVISVWVINFNNDRVEGGYGISHIYDQFWFRTTAALYSLENELLYESSNIYDNRYLIFDENHVTCCNSIKDECNIYNYSYNDKDKTIFIDSQDNKFIRSGRYDITFYENKFTLSITDEDYGYISVYTYEMPMG